MVERLTLDTNIFWHGLLPTGDPVAPVCRRIIEAIDDGEIEAWCSTLVLIELPKVLSDQMPVERLVALTETLRASRVRWVPLTESIAMRARELSLVQNVAPAYDSAILATAVEVGSAILMTNDRDDLPRGSPIDGVRVVGPHLPGALGQQQLDVGDSSDGL